MAIVANVDVNWDTPNVAAGTTGVDTLAINGATFTIDTDVRYCANHSSTTILGGNATAATNTVVISPSLGGTLKIDGNNLKMIPYSGGSGTLGALSTFITPTAMTWAAGVATITVTHTYAVGDTVVIANAFPAAWNGTFIVASIATTVSFTVAMPVDPTTIINIGATPAPTVTKMWRVSQALTKTNTSATRAANGLNWDVSVLTPNHNFVTGNTVTTAGMTPAAYNGTWTVTKIDNDNFKYTIIGGADNGAITVAGTSSKTVTAWSLMPWCANNGAAPTAITTTATTTTVTATHTLAIGDVVTFTGVTPVAYNGTYVVATVTGTTAFTYTRTDTPAAATVFGTFCAPERQLTLAAAGVPTTTINPYGFLKVKNVLNGPFEAGALTFQTGYGTTPVMTATAPEFVAPLEVVGADFGRISIPRLGKLIVQGAYFLLRSAPIYTTSIVPSGSAGAWTVTVTTTSYMGNATAQPHGFVVGQEITISGASSGYYNGTFRIATVPSTTTFTYTLSTLSTLANATVQGVIIPTVCTTGVNTKQYSLPLAATAPLVGVWVETDVGTEVYEFYPSASTLATASTVGTDAPRGKVCFITAAGILRIGHDGTQAQGYTPKAGLKIRIPNIITAGATTAAPATNSLQATLASRFGYVTSGAAYMSFDKCHSYFQLPALGSGQAFYIGMTNTTFADQILFSELASPTAWDNIHVGPTSAVGSSPISGQMNFAGGTINNSTFTTYTTATAGCASFTNMSGFTFNNCDFRSIINNITAVSTTVANSILALNLLNFTFNNCRILSAGRTYWQTCSDININNLKYGHWNGSSAYNITHADYIVEAILNCNRIKLDGVDWITSPIYSISCTNNVVTAKTLLPHGLTTGTILDIRSLTNFKYNTNSATITVVDSVTFTYPRLGVDLTTTVQGSGTWTVSNMCQPYAGFINVTASNYIKLRNVGSLDSRLYLGSNSGTITATGVIANTSTASSVGIGNEIKRVYVQNTRTGPFIGLNSYSGFLCENVFADKKDTYSILNLNALHKGCSWYHTPSDNTATFASVYGSHFLDVHIPSPKQAFIPCVTAVSTAVTSAALFGDIVAGMQVRGFGIPDGCTVASVTSTSALVLSAAATVAGNVRLQFAMPFHNATSIHSIFSSTTAGSDIITSNQAISCNTTLGTKIVTSAGLFGGIEDDMSVVGTGIPIGAKVVFAIDASNIVLSIAATATGTTTLTFPAMNLIVATSAISSTTVLGSSVLTTAASFAGLYEGCEIMGTGIPSGTRILSLTSTTSLTMSKPATAAGTVTVTFNQLSQGDIQVGMSVYGTGIPSGTHVTRVLDSQNIQISDFATVTSASTMTSFVNTASQFNILCNEPTSSTIAYVDQPITNSSKAGFNSLGSIVLPVKGDSCTWTTPFKMIGHTGFAAQLPSVVTGLNAANIAATSSAITVTALTANTNTIASTAAFLTTHLGMPIQGVGIPPDTIITAVASTSSITISNIITTAGATTVTIGASHWKNGETIQGVIGHNLMAGDTVVISGATVAGVGYNGVYVQSETPKYPNAVRYKQQYYPGAWTATPSFKLPYIAISAIASVWTLGYATITTSSAHGLMPGDVITICDSVCSVNPKNLNATLIVQAVPTTTQVKIYTPETWTWTSGGTIRPMTNIDLTYDLNTGAGFGGMMKNLLMTKKECFVDTRSIVVTASATPSLTLTSSTGVNIGDYVMGAGIPKNTYVVAKTSTANQITLSQPHTATATSTLFFAPTTNAVIKMGQAINCTTATSTTLTSTQTITATTTISTHTLTSTALFGNITVGMSVSGTGIPVGAYVVSIESTSSLTLSLPASATGTVSVIFVGFGAVSVGMYVAGTGIPVGTKVTAIASTSSLTLSNAATDATAKTLNFSWEQYPTANLAVGDYVFGNLVDLGSKIVSIDSSYQVTLNRPAIMSTSQGFMTLFFNQSPNEIIPSASTGFYLKVKASCNANSSVAIVSNIGVQTLSDNQSQSYQYPLDVITLTLTGLKAGSDIVVLSAGTSTELLNVDANPTTTYDYVYASPQSVDIGVFKAGYVPFYIRNYALSTANTSLPVAQVADRNYA